MASTPKQEHATERHLFLPKTPPSPPLHPQTSQAKAGVPHNGSPLASAPVRLASRSQASAIFANFFFLSLFFDTSQLCFNEQACALSPAGKTAARGRLAGCNIVFFLGQEIPNYCLVSGYVGGGRYSLSVWAGGERWRDSDQDQVPAGQARGADNTASLGNKQKKKPGGRRRGADRIWGMAAWVGCRMHACSMAGWSCRLAHARPRWCCCFAVVKHVRDAGWIRLVLRFPIPLR